MTSRPRIGTVSGASGELGALRWAGIDGAPTVIAVHGITSNAWHFDPLMHHLAGAAHVVAVDLRGRGRSADHPGPFGIFEHAADIAQVAAAIPGRKIVVGHSMGASVALAAAEISTQIDDLVLVDGGTPLGEPEADHVDADAMIDATLGPSVERLRTLWPDRVSYQAMWAGHPAFVEGISVDLERNLLADLVEVPGGFRAAVSEEAVRVDGRQLFADEHVRGLLGRRSHPVHIVRAPAGLDGAPPPLISDEVMAAFPEHRWHVVPETNHYTVMLSPKGASAVAGIVRSVLAR
ncbi:MAG: alpha/beta fold hydrolase [Actinomycetota bacterium]